MLSLFEPHEDVLTVFSSIPGLQPRSLVSGVLSLAPCRVTSKSHRTLVKDKTLTQEWMPFPRLCCVIRKPVLGDPSLEDGVRIRPQKKTDGPKDVPCTKSKAHHCIVL